MSAQATAALNSKTAITTNSFLIVRLHAALKCRLIKVNPKDVPFSAKPKKPCGSGPTNGSLKAAPGKMLNSWCKGSDSLLSGMLNGEKSLSEHCLGLQQKNARARENYSHIKQ
jgi:hypothetical protein